MSHTPRLLSYLLVPDGSSDRSLTRIIDWVLSRISEASEHRVASQVASRSPGVLKERVRHALSNYACDLLFVHRDAEGQLPDDRLKEIQESLGTARQVPWVPIVPVRMTEAWLLHDERAIRQAAGNPNGQAPLPIPSKPADALPDPKRILREALVVASEQTGRKLAQFKSRLEQHVSRVADLIDDFEPLTALTAFQRFEAHTRDAVQKVLM